MHEKKVTKIRLTKLQWSAAFILICITGSLLAQTKEDWLFPRFSEFRETKGIYEPSGIVQLPDQRLVVVEDERKVAVSIISLAANGDIHATPIKRESLIRSRNGLRSLGKLNDLEGMAVDKNGSLYAITSYSRTEKRGRASPTREKLVRFQIEGDRIINAQLVLDLKKHITAQFPVLKKAAKARSKRKTKGLEIEGMSFDKSGKHLWLGFRSPLKDNKAIIIVLHNPEEVFKHKTPHFSATLLDLNGAGIRSLSYDANLNGYLILARREDKKKMPFELWFWSGNVNDDAHRVKIDGIDSLRRAEAITPIKLGNHEGIIIFSDEGNAHKGKQGRYILLKYDQIIIGQ